METKVKILKSHGMDLLVPFQEGDEWVQQRDGRYKKGIFSVSEERMNTSIDYGFAEKLEA